MKFIKKPSLGTILGTTAIVIALSATGLPAEAASLITGAQIKNGSVTGTDIKDKSLTTKDIATSSINSLKGKTGATGAKGSTGNTGPQGPGSVDINYRFSSGNVTVATVDGFYVIGSCQGYGPRFTIKADGFPNLRVSGVQNYSNGALQAVNTTTFWFFNKADASYDTSFMAQLAVTNTDTGKTVHVDVYSTMDGADCVYSGQVTP